MRWPEAAWKRDAAVGGAAGIALMAACFGAQKVLSASGTYDTPAFLQAAFLAVNVPAIAVGNALTYLLVILGWTPPSWLVLALWFAASALVYAATWVIVRRTGHGRWPRVAVLTVWATWFAIVGFFYLVGTF